MVDESHAVLFGGYSGSGYTNDVYMLDLSRMVSCVELTWKTLKVCKRSGEMWVLWVEHMHSYDWWLVVSMGVDWSLQPQHSTPWVALHLVCC